MVKPITAKENTRQRTMIKMRIEKDDYDAIYPYAIKDAWGGTIYCTIEHLKELKKEIEKILDK